MNLQELQEAVEKGWTGELYSDEFRNRTSSYKDFDHALKHIRKAAAALENMTELADHASGLERAAIIFQREMVAKYISDIVISAARLANVTPFQAIDLDKAVIDRVEAKILPKK